MEATKIVVFLLSTFSLLSFTQTQDNKGQWKLLKHSIGISSMHIALLSNGRVVTFDRTDFGPSNISLPLGRCRNDSGDTAVKHDCTAHSVEFDPATRAVRPLMVLTDTWCSSGAFSPTGTLVQTGGFNDGDRAVRYFAPCEACDWTEDKYGLAVRRWYATNQILPDGRIIVVGGRGQFSYEFIPKAPSSDSSTFNLQLLQETMDWEKRENNLYPFVHLSPDGNLFIFANNKSILLDYISHRVVRSFPIIPSGFAHNYPSTGSSVLLPLQLDSKAATQKAEIMVCGGTLRDAIWMAEKGTYLPASSTCGRLTITDESPEWEMETMPIGRTMGDMVLLPTGDVLIINGAKKGTAGWCNGRDPALQPVLYRTGTTSEEERAFEVLNAAAKPRLYHSTAILLPDGRVLVGGSNPNKLYDFSGVLYPTELSIEAFSPPYLAPMARRPNITSMGSDIGYGERLSIKLETRMKAECEGVNGVRVTMVAPSFNSHSFSMNQRLLVLEVEKLRYISGQSYEVDVFAPAAVTLAPPGYYLVFVVHGGIPSHGRWVRIKQ